ncbi:Nicotinamide nicotinic acid mononucleotide adenylyltransferase 1 [Hyphodiscus hymeniophilus]|uniref:Nicotinamide-nucleotide adenylyltransferase n=1 Tax=Hyphodiscus hymeniophilus TaxID=353542 RepID=A0A9P6VDW2_9HELO|nr:Nicotinamide nicotinic acid mononucleotide adenylyltransferase 1 [Hyphodiscus hymeniophilus]
MASTPHVQSASIQTLDSYTFPRHRLRLRQNDPTRTPLVLVACGSFSPVTFLHLRMFEMAADFAKFNTEFEILGGYLSPVGDAYKKAGLASARHRLRMCELAVDSGSWVMVDPWEAVHPEYMPTAQVLDHFEHEINEVIGGAERPDGSKVPVRIALLAGADLILTMSTPGVWTEADLDHILGRYGTFIVERTGTDIEDAISNLQQYKEKIYVISQLITNDVSSTKIRLFLRREMSVRYLIPAPVIEYIEAHGLYEDDGASSVDGKAKSKGAETSGRASPAIANSSKS